MSSECSWDAACGRHSLKSISGRAPRPAAGVGVLRSCLVEISPAVSDKTRTKRTTARTCNTNVRGKKGRAVCAAFLSLGAKDYLPTAFLIASLRSVYADGWNG